MKDTIKKSLVGGLVFSLTAVSVFIVYATIGSTWTNPGDIEASSGTTLTSTNWNKMLANMNSLSGSINNSSWVLDTSGNGVPFSIGCDYKYEVLVKGTSTLSSIHYGLTISGIGDTIGYSNQTDFYRINNAEKNKYLQNGVTWSHDIGKIWKRCN